MTGVRGSRYRGETVDAVEEDADVAEVDDRELEDGRTAQLELQADLPYTSDRHLAGGDGARREHLPDGLGHLERRQAGLGPRAAARSRSDSR